MWRFALRIFRWGCAFIAAWYRRFERDPSRLAVGKLKNISPRLAYELQRLGVQTRAELVQLGALETYRLLLERGNSHSEQMLLALHGAITQQESSEIPLRTKLYLLEEAAALDRDPMRDLFSRD
ncbi:MAG: TfoX/Sxy family DNA transformation protein [Deinococcales bacterium]